MTNGQVRVDPGTERQVIDGFGVNITLVGHWRQSALRKTLDRRVDDQIRRSRSGSG